MKLHYSQRKENMGKVTEIRYYNFTYNAKCEAMNMSIECPNRVKLSNLIVDYFWNFYKEQKAANKELKDSYFIETYQNIYQDDPEKPNSNILFQWYTIESKTWIELLKKRKALEKAGENVITEIKYLWK